MSAYQVQLHTEYSVHALTIQNPLLRTERIAQVSVMEYLVR